MSSNAEDKTLYGALSDAGADSARPNYLDSADEESQSRRGGHSNRRNAGAGSGRGNFPNPGGKASQNRHGGHSNRRNAGADSARPNYLDSGDEVSQNLHGGHSNKKNAEAGSARPNYLDSGDEASQNLHGGHSNKRNAEAGSARPNYLDSGNEASQNRRGGHSNRRNVGADSARPNYLDSGDEVSQNLHGGRSNRRNAGADSARPNYLDSGDEVSQNLHGGRSNRRNAGADSARPNYLDSGDEVSQNLHGGHSNKKNAEAGSARPNYLDFGDEASQSRRDGHSSWENVGKTQAALRKHEAKGSTLPVTFLNVVTAVAVAAAVVYGSCFYLKPKEAVVYLEPAWKDSFQKELLHLGKPEMSDDDFSAIVAAANKWLDGDAKPTVLTLAGHGAEQFGLKLLECLNKIVGNTPNVRIQAQRDSTRQQLDDEVSEGLRSVNKPTVLVTNIQDLTWDSPMFIYIYADNDHHPIDNALLILTVNHKIDGKCSRGIRKLLETSWLTTEDTEMEEREKIEPAISRIVPFVACF